MKSNVVYIRTSQIRKAVKLSIIAQKFMDTGKRFGACVWSQSGLGKTATTDTLHEELTAEANHEYGLIDCNVSSSTPEDVGGFPQVVDGVLNFISQFKFKAGSRGIFRIDEFDRPAFFQTLIAVAKFAIDRQGNNHLPIDWFVLALGNGMSDAHTQELTEHLKGRFIHLYVSTNSSLAQKERLEYLEQSGASKTTIQYEKINPLLTRDEFEPHAIENHRTIKYADAILRAYDSLKDAGFDYSDVILPVLAGTIGKAGAVQMLRIHELGDMPTLDQVIANPAGTEMPDDLSLRHKYLTALVHEAQTDCDKAVKLMDYIVRYPSEVARYAIETLSLECPMVCKSEAYVKWFNRSNS
jgi:MoxR-like ATPase